MKHFFLDRQLNKLERQANNDLLLLMEVSPEYYSTNELKLLLIELKTKQKQVQKKKDNLFLIGATGFVWMVLYFFTQMMGTPWIELIAIGLIPMSFGTYIIGTIILERRNQFFEYAYHIDKIIRTEIERRKKDASIF